MTPVAGASDRYRVLLLGAQGQAGWELQRSQPPSVKLHALGRQDLDIRDANNLREAAESFQPDCLINAAYASNEPTFPCPEFPAMLPSFC
ncbi:sugar nucleotide-binding protein [Acidithiobacillus sp. CV18-2]|nr:sugar nucleotide-binding protein [Acidithiobacillus sp. CV18-3]MBU2758339.1 sugar nucleotide-binding protein [Acidithiobacillus sp. BN09-2]MBU2776239.1 sugar nucleotide-binding protein [Acidithiobacillus sp. CV18-2]MBU2800225.1 sugar nucleotide-binding protein [Acidithiobacillus sp. VAN18-4]